MTATESVEAEHLTGRVLGIIGAYEMGAAVDTRDLYRRPVHTSEPDPSSGEGYVEDGVYHVADAVSRG